MSFLSAGTDFAGGIAGSIEAKSVADFEAAQLDVMKTLSAARKSDAEAEIRGSYSEHAKANVAAAAISGFAAESFASVAEGNVKDMQKNLERVGRETDVEQMNLTVQQMEARLEGKRKARASMFSGINSALSTLHDAERSYQEYHTGETRMEAFKRSWKGGR
jgi:hypothetical protein